MFIDARTLPQNSLIEADICIAGAGAAGITLARDLAGGGRKIALFESGDFEYNQETQNLYAGEVVQQAYMPLDRDRLRFLGGSTNHWQGSCRPFDALDLADWPFGLEVLEPYYHRAHEVCQLGPYTSDPRDWVSPEAQPLDLGPESSLKNGVFQYSPPTRFGTAYRKDLTEAAGLTVYLNANLVQIQTDVHADAVTGFSLACLSGLRFSARAKHYVLSTGGIENVRLLLNSNRVQKSGLGNQNDLVGRYFMDHPFVPLAATVFADASSPQMRFYDHHVVNDHIIEGYLSASDEVRRKEKLPPFSLGLRSAGGEVDEGVGNIQLPSFAHHFLSDSAERRVSFYLPRLLDRIESPIKWVYEKMWRTPPGSYVVAYNCGPDPDPESRVTLTDKVDALGLRQTRLAWRLPANLEQQMHRALELLAIELGRTGVGRLRIESSATTGYDPMKDLGNGSHHMGTTRMHDDPRQGVVDANCKIHGIDNLFIAGSSVFPSYACDDPTLTIVALALRLSDHLKSAQS